MSEELRDGDRRNVSVLFADMKDFTALSEHMDPEEMDSLMGQVFAAFEAIIHRHGGFVEKYIGDALVAVFGVPSIHEDDPSRAINSALDFLDEISRLNRSIKNREAVIAFRIGITTGLITTGRRGDHDVVTGHAMTVASRLQSVAPVNSVLVAESTKLHCESEFVFSDVVPLSVKGKSEELRAFRVLERNHRPVDEDLIFVGRKEILDSILKRYLRHEPAQTDGFLLTGEAGIGKSRLAAQFVQKVEQLPDSRSPVLYAKTILYRTQPFSVVIDLLRSYLETDSVDPEGIKRLVIKELGAEEKTAAGFAQIVSGESEGHDNEAFVILYLLLKHIVTRFAGEPYPVVVFVEDLHLMDRHSRDFFRFYLKNATARPFFLLTDRVPDPGIREVFEGVSTAEIPPLTREESHELVMKTAPGHLDDSTIESIMENSRGNPLFVREYVRFVTDNRDTQALPTTIQNIFLTSIDAYDPPMRDLLKKLSVFAHSFSIEDARHVQSITDGDPRLVEVAIPFFVRESILVDRGELYLFKYDLFKKALYNSLLNYNKRILHRVIAELMETKGQPHPMRLLHHLIRAEEYEQATRALWQVPALHGNMEYLPTIELLLDHFRVDTADGNVDAYISLLFVKSAILFNNGVTEEADTLLKDIIGLAIQVSSPLYAGSAYHLLTAHNMQAYCFGKARACGWKGLAHYRLVETPLNRVQNLRSIMASSEMLCNKREDVQKILDDIQAEPSFGESPDLQNQLAIIKGEIHLMSSEYQTANDHLRGTIAALPGQDQSWWSAHLDLGLVTYHLSDWPELVRIHQVNLESPSRHYANISQVHGQLAVAYHQLGDPSAAGERIQQAEFNASQVHNDFDLVDAYRTLSECHLILGNRERAREVALAGLGIGLRHSATYPVLTLLMVLAELAWEAGETNRVTFLMTEAQLLVERGVLLRNRDLVLYHYYRTVRTAAPDEAPASRKAAREALLREIVNIGEENKDAFLATRSYRQIYGELFS